ncbi:MAG: amidohydrolase [Acidobacteriota bacterium]|nr:amidohydrolase [Acidobacteriota bacterium]
MTRRYCCIALALVLASALQAEDLDGRVDRELPALVEIYERLHARPELSYQEAETAAFIADELETLGFEVTRRVGRYREPQLVSHGLVGVMANGPGPTVLVRTDLDGLPVEEKTGLPYASRHTGTGLDGAAVATMHACGHDLHMTSFIGTARLLAEQKAQWRGTLVMIGQPAEERGAGALALLDDGLFERFPKPEMALALHAHAGLASGTVGLASGYSMANVDTVDIHVAGRGGHGAYPHTTKDPVTLAAQIITNLQTIVSRQISPFDPAVVTVGSIHGGTQHNVIPDRVDLQLTVRSYKPEVREQLLAAIKRTAIETARSAGFPDELLPQTSIRDRYTPANYNDPDLLDRLAAIWSEALGDDAIEWVEPVMAGEDFARYGMSAEIPTVLFWLGAVDPARIRAARQRGEVLPSRHSSGFAPLPGPAIRTGVEAMTSAVLDLLAP